jgi:hypothetical protein
MEKPGIISFIGTLMIFIGGIFVPWVSMNRVDEGVKLLKNIPLVGSLIGGLLEPRGWQLIFSPFTRGLIRWLIIGTFTIMLIVGVVSVIELIKDAGVGQSVSLGLAGVSAIICLLLIINIPTVLHYGSDDNSLIAIASATGEARIGWGFWIVLVGLFVIIGGLLVDMNKEGENESMSYSAYPNYRRS